MPKVVTANTLATGRVVFLADKGVWVEAIREARLFDDSETAEDGLTMALSDAEKAIIVEPFIADVTGARDGRPQMALRDSIRAYGPTIKFLPSSARGA